MNEALMVSLIAVDAKLRLNILLWPPAAGPLTTSEPSSLYNDQNLEIKKLFFIWESGICDGTSHKKC